MTEKESTVGHYAILVIGNPTGWDSTAMGIALYDGSGDLIWSKFEPLQKAIDRGDWLAEWVKIEVPHHLPGTWAVMQHNFERTGNAMSTIRWYEGGVTLEPDKEHGEQIYKMIVGEPKYE